MESFCEKVNKILISFCKKLSIIVFFVANRADRHGSAQFHARKGFQFVQKIGNSIGHDTALFGFPADVDFHQDAHFPAVPFAQPFQLCGTTQGIQRLDHGDAIHKILDLIGLQVSDEVLFQCGRQRIVLVRKLLHTVFAHTGKPQTRGIIDDLGRHGFGRRAHGDGVCDAVLGADLADAVGQVRVVFANRCEQDIIR